MAILLIFVIIGLGGLYFWHIAMSVPKEMRHTQTQQELAAKLKEKEDAELLADIELMAKKAQAFIQANLSGHEVVADAINSGSYTGPLPEKRDDGGWLSVFDNLRILKIAGINHRKNIGQYTGRVECALVPEPSNEFDPNAIKVVAEDSHHLGYIPSDQTDFVRSMTANEFPYRCTAFIEDHEDEIDGHKFFTGFVYIKRLD